MAISLSCFSGDKLVKNSLKDKNEQSESSDEEEFDVS